MNKIFIIIPLAVAIAAGSFFGGMKYAESKDAKDSGGRRGNFSNLANLTPEQRQQKMLETGGRRVINGGTNGEFAAGQIISSDGESITVKLNDGGSRIIFYSEATRISKFADGQAGDLENGKNIMASGTKNQDGSLTAQSIQIRPEAEGQPHGGQVPTAGGKAD